MLRKIEKSSMRYIDCRNWQNYEGQQWMWVAEPRGMMFLMKKYRASLSLNPYLKPQEPFQLRRIKVGKVNRISVGTYFPVEHRYNQRSWPKNSKKVIRFFERILECDVNPMKISSKVYVTKDTHNEYNATNDDKQESQIENDVEYIFQSKSLSWGPFVNDGVTANAR